MRKFRRAITSLLVMWFTLSSSTAFANSLTSTVPISGAILNVAPSAVTLTTQAPLADMGSEISVTDPKGSKVDDGTLTIDGNSAVVGVLPLTEKGIYTVQYSLITDNDVPLTGSYTFTFNAPDKITTPTPVDSKSPDVKTSSNFGTTLFVILVAVAALVVAVGLILYGRKLYKERK